MTSTFTESDRTYVSAVEAARKFGYSGDYVSRLCRTKKVSARLVGRAWFVDVADLEAYIKNAKVQKKLRSQELARERKLEYLARSTPQKSAEPDPAPMLEVSPDAVSEEGEPDVRVDRDADEFEVSYPIALYDQSAVIRAALLSVMLVASMFLYVATPNASETTIEVAEDAYQKIASIIFETNADSLPAQTSAATTKPAPVNEIPAEVAPASQGVVIVGATDDEATNAAVLQSISESFSDEVEIVEGEDGRSGIIRPVFKYPTDDEYLYLMVPVEAKKGTSTAQIPIRS